MHIFNTYNQGGKVIVNGEVVHENYAGGDIKIYWDTQRKIPLRAAIILDKPGKFSLKIPRNVGQVFISAKAVDAITQASPLVIKEKDISLFPLRLYSPRTVSGPVRVTLHEVLVTGKVAYPEFNDGNVTVYWTKDNLFPQGEITLEKPGPFSFTVPKNAGKIYVHARCCDSLSEVERYIVTGASPIARTASESIMIGTGNVDVGELRLEKFTKRLSVDHHPGQTISICGKVIQKTYLKGLILITVSSQENYKKYNVPPDIALKVLPEPGEYCVAVPRQAGRVYLRAINVPHTDYTKARITDPATIWGEYRGDVLVGVKDITDVDIILDEKNEKNEQ